MAQAVDHPALVEHIGVLRPLRVGTHAVEDCTQSELVHVIFAHGSTRPLEIQFAVVPEPPPEPEPEPETREQQLAHLSKRQLRQRAEKAGVAPGKLKKAQSGSTPTMEGGDDGTYDQNWICYFSRGAGSFRDLLATL